MLDAEHLSRRDFVQFEEKFAVVELLRSKDRHWLRASARLQPAGAGQLANLAVWPQPAAWQLPHLCLVSQVLKLAPHYEPYYYGSTSCDKEPISV